MKKIVVIGGGTGSSIVLKALKNSGHQLYAIVPMGDSGGSTGRLRDEFGVLSSGEIRQRLMAMASDDEETRPLRDLLDYRFQGGGELRGHNLGNLIICGFTEMYGSQKKAVEILSKVLKIRGEIVPSTFDRFDLAAKYADGSKIIGEHDIDETKTAKRIIKLYTEPAVTSNPRAIDVIKSADMIIFSMGDLYTSILHAIIVGGIKEAISKSRAKKIYVSNLMTSFGETIGMTLGDHVAELEKYTDSKIDEVVANSGEMPMAILSEYRKNSEEPVKLELTNGQKKRIKITAADLISEEIYKKSDSDVLRRNPLRHDPNKLRKVILSMI